MPTARAAAHQKPIRVTRARNFCSREQMRLPVIHGYAGCPGSGKSTVGRLLMDLLPGIWPCCWTP
jgi:hypothetical protein